MLTLTADLDELNEEMARLERELSLGEVEQFPVLPLYGPPDNGMLSFRLPAARRDAFKAWCRPGDA